MAGHAHVRAARPRQATCIAEGDDVEITLDDARWLVAREHGFDGWAALTAYLASVRDTPTVIAAKPVAPFFPGEPDDDRRARGTRDWSAAIALLRDQRIPGSTRTSR